VELGDVLPHVLTKKWNAADDGKVGRTWRIILRPSSNVEKYEDQTKHERRKNFYHFEAIFGFKV
jgi:hypothetical protein